MVRDTMFLDDDEGMAVIRCQMYSGVTAEANEKLVKNGIGGVDYGVGATLEGDGEEKRSFDVLQRISRTGAYGVITWDSHEYLAVGIATSPCAMFLEVPHNEGKTITLKAFQFDRYATVTPDRHPEIQDRLSTHLRNYDQHQTLTTIKKEDRKKGIYRAVHELEEAGELR